MGYKLYVGNLPFSITDEKLQEMFAKAGTVQSAKVIMDHVTGRSKGFAFVEMSSEQEATEAISQLNGKDFEGRTLKVAEAKPQAPRTNRSGGGGRDRGGFRGERY